MGNILSGFQLFISSKDVHEKKNLQTSSDDAKTLLAMLINEC